MPLLTPYGPNMPTVQAFSGRDGGQALMFKIPMQDGGSVLAAILAPRTDWQGPLDFSVASPSDPEGRNPPVVIGEATAELSQQEGYPMRLARLQMRRDELGVGNVCLMFRGQQGQRDVQFSGAEFCVADGARSPMAAGVVSRSREETPHVGGRTPVRSRPAMPPAKRDTFCSPRAARAA